MNMPWRHIPCPRWRSIHRHTLLPIIVTDYCQYMMWCRINQSMVQYITPCSDVRQNNWLEISHSVVTNCGVLLHLWSMKPTRLKTETWNTHILPFFVICSNSYFTNGRRRYTHSPWGTLTTKGTQPLNCTRQGVYGTPPGLHLCDTPYLRREWKWLCIKLRLFWNRLIWNANRPFRHCWDSPTSIDDFWKNLVNRWSLIQTSIGMVVHMTGPTPVLRYLRTSRTRLPWLES